MHGCDVDHEMASPSASEPCRRARDTATTIGVGAWLSALLGVWHPDDVALRTALGKALYRAPGALRRGMPRAWRDGLRSRIGPFAPWEAGFTHTPPALGPGESAGPPDFVGIGVQKAGTTWWFGLIAAHPEVTHRAEVHKERHFFAPYATQSFGPQDAERYHAWFARAQGTKAGEWTPDYFYQAWVPSLLDQAAPRAHLLLMLRDPVERLVSGLAHSNVLRATHHGTAVAEAVERGRYAAALRRWSRPFAEARILVLQYERCVADPAGELARTYRFLGIDDAFRPDGIERPASATPGEAKVRLEPDARRRLVELYRDDVADLAALLPDLDLALWPNFTGIP